MILFTTLGFEEKYLLREVFRRGVKDRLGIFVLVPEEMHERTEKAYQTVKDMLSKLEPNIFIDRIKVPLQDPYKAIYEIRSSIKAYAKDKEEVVVNLSGGQRLLIFCVTAALSSLGIRNIKVSIESEDGKYYFELPSDVLIYYDLDELDNRILEAIRDGHVKIKDLLTYLNISRVTLWRKVKRMKKLGLIEELEGKRYRLTEIGLTKI
ncbi:MAG TPA: CRISPR-associated CARF protein Csa3 [Geobacterales bacterium]|nr:CRISPR-associated CARF protein Csa3 [Geobacterales bacterium]